MLSSGKYKTGEQILRLTNERFAVPETLFHPSDIGIQEMGIPEAVVRSISSMPPGNVTTHNIQHTTNDNTSTHKHSPTSLKPWSGPSAAGRRVTHPH